LIEQEEKPEIERGKRQSPGNAFISLIENSSTSSDWIPNSSLPPKTSIYS
jgi:hypothetical protein